jgi:isocitrate dehydrogenase
VSELLAVQGSPVDIGGYYHPDVTKVTQVMRPSAKLSEVLAILAK